MNRAVLVLVLLTGCMGSFRLTRSVYAFNDQITDSKVVKELVFVAFLLVPVYEVAAIADTLFLNVAETITGDNPIRTVPEGDVPQSDAPIPEGDAPPPATLEVPAPEPAPEPEGDGAASVIPDPGGDGAWIRVGERRAARVVRRGGSFVLLEGGATVATVTAEADGSLVVADRAGRSRRIGRDAVERATRAAPRGGKALADEVRAGWIASAGAPDSAEHRVTAWEQEGTCGSPRSPSGSSPMSPSPAP